MIVVNSPGKPWTQEKWTILRESRLQDVVYVILDKEAMSLVTEWLLCHGNQTKTGLEDRFLCNKNVFRKYKWNVAILYS